MDQKEQKNIWTFFIDRLAVTILVIVGFILMGLFSFSSIPREVQPEIIIPIGSVSTFLPGANPTDVESLITEPLEERIAQVSDIKTLSSTSGIGISTIVIEFEANVDLDQAIQDLKDQVDLAKSELPEDATDPVVNRAEANTYAIATFSLSGDLPLHQLTSLAETIQDELEQISGVSRVDLLGGESKEVQVAINPEKAEENGISISQVAQAIKAGNFNVPVGLITTDKLNYSVRIDNRFQKIEDLQNMILFRFNDPDATPLYLKDIAQVEEVLKKQSTISRLSIEGTEPQKTISLQLYKKDGTNIIEIVDNAKAKIEELKVSVIPPNVNIAVTNDYSQFIRTDLGILTKSGIQTTILIIIILFLALGFTEGVLAGLSIPLTLLAAIAVIDFYGMTLNGLTLFSLVIALGLMVDTAIVIMEGIHENLKEGQTARDAAINSIETYKWPLVAGTLTTIFAFFPMLLVSGIVGQFLKSLPITISVTLIISLFVSFTIIPSLTVKFMKNRHVTQKTGILSPFFNLIGPLFQSIIAKILDFRILRILVILIAIILFMGSMALPITGALKVEMFPKTDVNYFLVNVETPKGLIIEETEKIVQQVESELMEIPEVSSFLSIIGSGQGVTQTDLVSFGGGTSSNVANITVNLVEKEERAFTSYQLAESLREVFKNFNGAKVTVQELSEGPPSSAPVTVRLSGEDLEGLKELSQQIQKIVEETEGTVNVRSTLEKGLNEFRFTLDNDLLTFHGLAGVEVASRIRNIIQGVEATEIKLNQEDTEIIVRYDIPEKNTVPELSVEDIENISINTPKGYSVKLGDVANFELTESLNSIDREDQKRIISILSDVSADITPIEITTKIQAEISKLEIPSDYDIDYSGATADVDESFNDLFRSMIIGIILIAFTLVMMFNSLKQPFIILLTLPLALIGVFPGLLIVGLNLSFPAFLGVVALSGVVVNDAIVLIDRINKTRLKHNTTFKEAIAEAANSRLQPIIMTTITTVIGILPLSLTNEFWAGLGFSLIFGLIAGTFLTLIVIPVLYHAFEARKAKKLGY